MKSARLMGLILAVVQLVISFVGMPAIAQQDEAAALDKKVAELRRAGKFSEAIDYLSGGARRVCRNHSHLCS